jgi:hypothetical protein
MIWKFENSLVACARWETDTIVEWLTYHRSIGFDHVYLYCNDDDPRELFEKILPFNLGVDPFVTFVFHPVQGDQGGMYRHFLRTYRQETERFMFFDVDEFLCLRGVDNIRTFLRSGFQDFDDIYFNWVWFGNSGFATRPKGSVLLNYTRRADGVFILTKHLVRSAIFNGIFDPDNVPGPFHHALPPSPVGHFSRVNVLGEDFSDYLGSSDGEKGAYLGREDRTSRILATACVFHYAFKSEQDLLTRAQRGTGGSFSGQVGWKQVYESGKTQEFFEPLNRIEETYLQRYWAEILSVADLVRCTPPRPREPNIAPAGHADQSSVSTWSRHGTTSEDAAGAVSGRVTGSFQFHTSEEDQPWWSLTFPRLAEVSQIWIYNRLDVPNRANDLLVDVETPQGEWRQIAQWAKDTPFGGADGKPLILSFTANQLIRSVRVRLPSRNFLHLDQVEVYGRLVDADDTGFDASQTAESPGALGTPAVRRKPNFALSSAS